MKFLMLIIIFILHCGCGKKPSKHKGASDIYLPEPDGSFSAKLFPFNSQLTQHFKGLVTVTKYGDDFHVKIKYRNGPKGHHRQGLYSSRYCGTDTNPDFGPMVIPFDGDLSAEANGKEDYPEGENFDYEQSTSYSLMLANSKLRNTGLELEGKIVVIRSDNFPTACGVLTKVNWGSDDPEPDKPPGRVRPKPPRRPEVEPWPPPYEEPEVRPRTLWQRLRDRLVRWWRRIWHD